MNTLHPNNIFAEHYLLKERLSSGAIAEVWKAEDWTAEGAIVAVKIYLPQSRLDNYTLDLLTREHEKLASLKHPNLLTPYRHDVYEGIPFLVMPFMTQGSLRQKMLETGPLPEQELARIVLDVGSALKYLHAHQPALLHRHLSADSILIADDGRYVLSSPAIDSKLLNTLHKADGSSSAAKEAYAAPELFSTHPVYHETSDIFSLGVLLYELSSGELPWSGSGGQGLHKGASVPSLPNSNSRIFNNLVRTCLHPNWDKRPSAKLLAEEAAYFLNYGKWKSYGAFGQVTAASIVYKRRPALIPIVLASLFVIAALAAAYYFYFKDNFRLHEKIATMTRTSRSAGQASDDTTAALDAPAKPDSTVPSVKSDTQASAKLPTQKAAPAADQSTVITKPTPEARNERPTAPQKVLFPRPTSLDGYLNGMLDDEIPLHIKEQWRPAIRKYFAPDAIVYAQMNGSPLGSFGVAEFLDILLSSEPGSTLTINEIIRGEENGKISEINLSIYSTN